MTERVIFKKRLFEETTDAEKKKIVSKKPRVVRNPLFGAVETALNHFYDIADWTCIDEESSPTLLHCEAQGHSGLKMLSDKNMPHRFGISRLSADESDNFVGVFHPLENEGAKSILLHKPPCEDNTDDIHSDPIKTLLARYIKDIQRNLGKHASLFDPSLQYNSMKKGGKTYVKYEMTSKITTEAVVMLRWPWPGADRHQFRLEKMCHENLGCKMVFSFVLTDADAAEMMQAQTQQGAEE